MMLSDEAIKKRDELALEQDTQYWGPGVGEHFKDGFDAGYEFAKSESKNLLVNCVLSAHGLKEKLDQERDRTQKLVEVLKRIAFGCFNKVGELREVAIEAIKAHKAGG